MVKFVAKNTAAKTKMPVKSFLINNLLLNYTPLGYGIIITLVVYIVNTISELIT